MYSKGYSFHYGGFMKLSQYSVTTHQIYYYEIDAWPQKILLWPQIPRPTQFPTHILRPTHFSIVGGASNLTSNYLDYANFACPNVRN